MVLCSEQAKDHLEYGYLDLTLNTFTFADEHSFLKLYSSKGGCELTPAIFATLDILKITLEDLTEMLYSNVNT